jgi:hypothetical protein
MILPSVESIKWEDPIRIRPLDIGNLNLHLKRKVCREILKENLPNDDAGRHVYIIRVTGPMVIHYHTGPSPTLYVAEGASANRLLNGHIEWIADFMHNIRQAGIEIQTAVPRRRGCPDFYKCIEADLLDHFQHSYGALPFFNKNREKKFLGRFTYSEAILQKFRAVLGIGKGHKPLWIIEPCKNHPAYFTYQKGSIQDKDM